MACCGRYTCEPGSTRKILSYECAGAIQSGKIEGHEQIQAMMDRPPGSGRQPHSPANRMDEAYVKISRSGLLCLGLLLGSWSPAVYAQDEPQKGPPPRSGTGGLQTPPPPIPKVPDVRQPGEYGWWAEINGWFPCRRAISTKAKTPHSTPSLMPPWRAIRSTPKVQKSAWPWGCTMRCVSRTSKPRLRATSGRIKICICGPRITRQAA